MDDSRRRLALLLAVLRQRMPVLAGLSLTTLALALSYGWLAPDRYRAVATLFVEPSALLGVDAEAGGAGVRGSALELLRSDRVALRVAENEHLAEEPSLRATYLQAVESGRPPLEVLAHALGNQMDARAGQEGGVVQVAVTMADPRLAARLANAYARAWGEVTLELRAASIREGVERAHHDLVALRARLGEAQARVRGAAYVRATDADANARFADLARFATRPLHPVAPEAPGGVAAAEPSLVDSIDAGHLPQRADAPASGEGAPEAPLLRAPAPGAPVVAPRGGERASADDEIRLAQHSLERAEERLTTLSVEAIGAPSAIHTLVAAPIPDSSVKPDLAECAVIGLGAGLLLGLVGVLAVERLDRRVRGAGDLARELGVVVLGHLPSAAPPQRVPLAALRWVRGRRAHLAG